VLSGNINCPGFIFVRFGEIQADIHVHAYKRCVLLFTFKTGSTRQAREISETCIFQATIFQRWLGNAGKTTRFGVVKNNNTIVLLCGIVSGLTVPTKKHKEET
jgi:hypothetical protein